MRKLLESEAPVSDGRSPVCPVCGGRDSGLLWSATVEVAAQYFILREEDRERRDRLADCIRRLWGGDKCDVRECRGCGFGFAWPYVAGDAEFYGLAYPRTSYPSDRWEYGRTLQALQGRADEWCEGWALEVRAGVGNFLARLPLDPGKVVAAEYSVGGASALRSAGYAVHGGDIREEGFRSGYRSRFALVFMFHVLEHMDGLDGMFGCLRDVTTLGARVFISVPDTRHTRWTEEHGGLMDMPPNHIGQWAPASLSVLARRMGFEVRGFACRPWCLSEFIRSDAISAYMCRAQRHGSLPNRLRRMSRSKPCLAIEAAMVGLSALARIRHLPSALRSRSGDTVWAELRRAECHASDTKTG